MSTIQNLSDDTIKQAVLEALSWEPSVTQAHIGVIARDGVVTLTRNVRSYAEKYAAEKAVQRVKGVKAVAEEIKVRLPSDVNHRDDDIAAAAVSQLTWDSEIPSNAVKVRVEKGLVTLTGQVEHHFQTEAAAQHVRRLSGVVGVINQISIKPQVNALNISDDIQNALHRSWFFDPELVHVRAKDGKVTLTGKVSSLHDRQTAAMTAWAAYGATSVENDIVVS